MEYLTWHLSVFFFPKKSCCMEKNHVIKTYFKRKSWKQDFPVVQWVRICLPLQGTKVQSLVQENFTCCGAFKPMHNNHWTHGSRACSLQVLNPCAATIEAHAPVQSSKDPVQPKIKYFKKKRARKDWGQKEKRQTEDQMVGWHYWLNGHLEQAPGDGAG